MNKLNPKISPLYQAILHFSANSIPFGAGDANYIELIDCILIHFNKLKEMYEEV